MKNSAMYWNTVSPLLKQVLADAMQQPLFDPFRLVGGTSLSLQYGHRESVDIDLFTDAEYDSLDFNLFDEYFRSRYPYVDTGFNGIAGMGTTWFVGQSRLEAVKVDIYYTDPFIRDIIDKDEIRLASPKDIIAMKLEVIGNGGRKKDFWDLHLLHDYYSISQMIGFYKERNPYGHTDEELRKALIDFRGAEDDFDPVCLLGKYWEFIKLDFTNWLNNDQPIK